MLTLCAVSFAPIFVYRKARISLWPVILVPSGGMYVALAVYRLTTLSTCFEFQLASQELLNSPICFSSAAVQAAQAPVEPMSTQVTIKISNDA